jgi:hypothetical protein
MKSKLVVSITLITMSLLCGATTSANAGFGNSYPNCSDTENAGTSQTNDPSGAWVRTQATNLFLSYGSDDKDKRKTGSDQCAGLGSAQDVGIQLSYALVYYMPYSRDSKNKLIPLSSKDVAVSYVLQGNQKVAKEVTLTLSAELSANASVTMDKKGPSATVGVSGTVGTSKTYKFSASTFSMGSKKPSYPCEITKRDDRSVWQIDCRFNTGKTDLKWNFPGGGITSVIFEPTTVVSYGKGKTFTSRGYLTF